MSQEDNKDQEDNYKKAQDNEFKVEKAPQIDLLVDTDSF